MYPDLYVISDLHMCDGSKIEDFLPQDDAALVGFLDSLTPLEQCALIINGDFIDFVQVQPGSGQFWFNEELDASEVESLEKLECVISAHTSVFAALGRFVGAGHTLHFHYGNHDIDLVWPRVQARMRQELGLGVDSAAVTFGESHLIGGVYIEHGHQADKNINCFPEQPEFIRRGPDGVDRLTRCWGTRFVEEFYNKIEALPGCGTLDNVRPRMKAAVIIIKHAILNREMHPMLISGLRVILSTLAELKTEQDFTNAASELGVSRGVMLWIVRVARWLGIRPSSQPAAQAKSVFGEQEQAAPAAPDAMTVPSLQRAYTEEEPHTAQEMVDMAPAEATAQAKDLSFGSLFGADQEQAAEIDPELEKSLKYVLEEVVAKVPGASDYCVGHTHTVTSRGVPLPGLAALYHNSGSWTMTLNLGEIEDVDFAYLQDPAHFRQGRDYLYITWPNGETPVVENRQWQ